MHADFCSTFNISVDFTRLFLQYTLHQNVWQWVSRLHPDPLESPREGREERRIEGGREVAWSGPPKISD